MGVLRGRYILDGRALTLGHRWLSQGAVPPAAGFWQDVCRRFPPWQRQLAGFHVAPRENSPNSQLGGEGIPQRALPSTSPRAHTAPLRLPHVCGSATVRGALPCWEGSDMTGGSAVMRREAMMWGEAQRPGEDQEKPWVLRRERR